MATKRWLGAAQDLPSITTYTFADTFASGDTVDVEINNKTLRLTLGTDVALSDVAAETAAMIMATSESQGKVGSTLDETRNFGGREIPEFTEITATASGAVLTIKSTPGIPVTVTVSVTTAGDGTVGSPSVVQAATGKNFFDNADNWSGGSNPSTGDTILFDQGAVDVLYGLANTTTDLFLIRTNAYTGNIGLPAVHGTGSSAYIEYRQRYLILPVTDTTGVSVHIIGEANSPLSPAGYSFLDFGTNTPSQLLVTVNDAPARDASVGYYVQLFQGKNMDLEVNSGSVLVGGDMTLSQTRITSLEVDGDGELRVMIKGLLNDPCPVIVNNGTMWLECDSAGGAQTFVIHGGNLYYNDNSGATGSSLTCRGGITRIGGGIVTNLAVYSGAILEEIDDTQTFTNAQIYKGASLRFPRGNLVFTNGLDLHGCSLSDVTIQSQAHRTWTPSAI